MTLGGLSAEADTDTGVLIRAAIRRFIEDAGTKGEEVTFLLTPRDGTP
jgi:hypothetical protein